MSNTDDFLEEEFLKQQAADKELRAVMKELETFQKLKDSLPNKGELTEPPKIEIPIPYTDTVKFQKQIALIEEQLKEMRQIQSNEQRARMEESKKAEEAARKQMRESRIWQSVTVTIGLLTLAATIIFGIPALLR